MRGNVNRRVNEQHHKVLRFHAPNQHILSAVEADCRRLRIPTYDEIEGVYKEALRRYWNDRDFSAADARFSAALQRQSRDLGVPVERLMPFSPMVHMVPNRDADLRQGLILREHQYEAGAYLLGLYVARREYPRLGGGVL